jgi:hypothetical protein
MSRKRQAPKQIIRKLLYDRWRKKYGGLRMDPSMQAGQSGIVHCPRPVRSQYPSADSGLPYRVRSRLAAASVGN